MNRKRVIEILSLLGRKSKTISKINKTLSLIEMKHMSRYDDVTYAKKYYKKYTGKRLDLDNPKSFNEKIWWLKLYNRDPLLTVCSDKYAVRDYVKECGLRRILTNIYGVYKNANDINFDQFEDEVFLKCTHGSGVNIIYDPNKPFDRSDFINTFNSHLKHNAYLNSREWGYKNIKPQIICEEVIRDKSGQLPEDYKFLCFDGEPKLLIRSVGVCGVDGRHSVTGERISNVYDMDYKYIPIITSFPTREGALSKRPENFEDMILIARILSKPFPHCRVDLYNINGKIYFGEITFYHSGGCGNIEPEEWALKMGEWINLDSPKIKRSETK